MTCSSGRCPPLYQRDTLERYLGGVILQVGSCPLFLFVVSRLMQPLDRVRAIAERVAGSRGLEIWDVQSKREAQGQVVRVFIDRPGPAATPEESVSIEDCAEVNREMSTILDVEDPLPFAYTLEVSSPGLDRPLRQPEDYRRFAGRLAKVVVSEAVDNQKAFEGRLRGLEDDAVLFEAPNGRMHRLPLRLITRARLEVEF
jgi:ribosome maturation factor RimP